MTMLGMTKTIKNDDDDGVVGGIGAKDHDDGNDSDHDDLE